MPWYEVELEREGAAESGTARRRKVNIRASDEESAGRKAQAENAGYGVHYVKLPMSQTAAFRFMCLCFAATGIFVALIAAGVIK